MRGISLFVLIAFTFSTFFQVVHIGYAENHPPTREEFNDLKEVVEEHEKTIEEQGKTIEEQGNTIEELTSRDGWDVAGDLVLTVSGVAGVFVGGAMALGGGVTTLALPFTAPVTVPNSALGIGLASGSGVAVIHSGGNTIKDIGNAVHSVGNFVGDVADKVTDAAANAFLEIVGW